ncbi:MAG: cyclic nucleotide-binding domain-containing protein [Myxococcota bacterium]
MDLVTVTAFAPGDGPSPAGPEALLVRPQLGLLAVADAPSGGDAARAGARLALELVRAHVERNEDLLHRFRRHPTPELRAQTRDLVEEAFARAAQEVYAFARARRGSERRRAVRVTLDVLLVLDTAAFVGHVGDGRVYLVRRGLVHQLTVDHSRSDEAHELAATAGPASAGSGAAQRSTRALGPEPRVEVASAWMEVAPDDRFVLCAASLHRGVPEAVLHGRFTSDHLSALARGLVADAGNLPVLAIGAQLGSGEPFTADSAQARLAILAPMPLFAHCTERELRIVALATHPRQFPGGAVVFEEGQPGTELYLVIAGAVDVVKNGNPIVRLGPGSTFGEMAMLDEPVRSATARTVDETELMVISRQAFFAMLRANPPLAVKILWNLTLRLSANLRQTSARLAELELDRR